jgi:aryl-alcohol dehydrogenase-like predicted oxidoreductase
VQFHWWDYRVPGLVQAALALRELQREGLIAHLGGTNFDSAHTLDMLEAGVPLVSMQVQYSLLDRRPAHALAAAGARHGMQLLCYGTLAGGFFSERWLGQDDPADTLTNRSLIKYRLVIEDFGGWAAFQTLLGTLKAIAVRHGVRIATVATRWVLDQPGVAAAIVGARYADHLGDTLAVFGLQLDAQDHALLAPLLAAHPGPEGDACGKRLPIGRGRGQSDRACAGMGEVGEAQIRAAEVGAIQARLAQVGPPQIGAPQLSVPQVGVHQIGVP